MKSIAFLSAIVISLPVMSFTYSAQRTLKLGAYGTCACEEGGSAAAKIELTFNEDHTFHYINSTDPSRPVDVKGNWTEEGKTIRLKDYKSDFPINDKWTIDDKCIRSRLGLLFTRICHKQECR